MASKYPVIMAKVDCFPTINRDLGFDNSSLMLIKVDLGLKSRKNCYNRESPDQLKEETDAKRLPFFLGCLFAKK